jgi:PAS domain S-box-containing protein
VAVGAPELRPEQLEVTTVGEAVVVTDAEHRVVEWNPAAERMFGVAREEALGRQPGQWVRCGDGLEAIDAALANGGRYRSVHHYTRADGSEGLSDSLIVPIVRDGARVGHLGLHRDLTERESALRALKASEEKYRTIVETSNDVIFSLDRDGRFTFANPALRDVLGWSPHEVVGHHFTELTLPDAWPEQQRIFQKAFEGEPVFAWETAGRHRDGRPVQMRVNAVALRGPAGDVVGVTGTVADVTEALQARLEMENSRRLLRSIIDNAAAGIYCKDPDGRYVLVNEKAAKLVGLPVDELVGKTDHDLFPRSIADGLRARDLEVLRTGRRAIEEEVVPFHGEMRTFLSNKFSMTAPDGGAALVVGISTDITERKRMEEALRDSRRMLEESQRFARLGSWSWNPQTGEVAWSPELYRIYGLPADSPVDFDSYRRHVHPQDWPATERAIAAAVTDAEPFSLRYRIVRPDGEERWLDSRGEPVLDDGQVVQLIGSCQDVTELTEAADELLTRTTLLAETQKLSLVGSYELDLVTGAIWWSDELCRLHGLTPEEFGATLEEGLGFIHPEDRLVAEATMARVVTEREPVELEYRIVRTDGEVRTVHGRGMTLFDPSGRPLKLVGAVQDVTERRRTEARLERRVREHAALADLGRMGLSGASLTEVLHRAATSLREILSVDYAAMLEPTEGGASWQVRADAGVPASLNPESVFPNGKGSQSGSTLRSGLPTIVSDWRSEKRFRQSALMSALGMNSSITVIVGDRAHPFGVLGAAAREPRSFDSGEINFMQAVANVLADAIARTHTEARLARHAQERRRLVAQALEAEDTTRRRISEALHDEAVQNLLAARQDLEDARAGDPESLDRLEEAIDRTLKQLRESVSDLHPIALQHGGLVHALRAVARHKEESAGFRCEVHVSPSAVGRHDQLVLSLARELLVNAAKHSRATEVALVVDTEPGYLVLAVTDNGVGIPAGRREQALAQGHIGLASSAERVRAIGGSFEVRSEQGGGTTVRATLPLSDRPD